MKQLIFTVCVMLLSAASARGEGQLRINEILQSNVDITYEWPEFPDSWVELYNSSDSPVDLTTYRLGEGDFASAWPAGDLVLAPGEFRVVFCDKNAEGRHTDFRLDSGKGELYLYDPEGNVIDRLVYPKQPAPNIAYALTAAGWSHVVAATPARANTEPAAETMLPEPVFSLPSAVYAAGDDPVVLTVSAPQGVEIPSDAVLCVTTDGRRPEAADMVPRRTWTAVIGESTVVRARFISRKALSPLSTTRSYIFTPEPTELDVISIVSNADYFFHEYLGIFGQLCENRSNPRRPIHIEYFRGPDHEPLFAQVGEARVQGGSSRSMPQKSLAVYSHKRFGTKGFNAALWPDKPEVTRVESFLLRNGGNSWAYQRFNDQLLQTLLGRARPMEWQAYTPALYFINGRYMGITDVRERSNDEIITSNRPGIGDFDMVENYAELKSGTMERHEQLQAYLNSDTVSLEGISQRVDVDNFLNLFATEIFAQNHDFPQNNVVSWRPATADARWRGWSRILTTAAGGPGATASITTIWTTWSGWCATFRRPTAIT